jgi:hypothetical protein
MEKKIAPLLMPLLQKWKLRYNVMKVILKVQQYTYEIPLIQASASFGC